MEEMRRRGYNPDPVWMKVNWRGNILGEEENWANSFLVEDLCSASRIYPEHDDAYLAECIALLKEKQAPIDWEQVEREKYENFS